MHSSLCHYRKSCDGCVQEQRAKERLEQKRERKAARTLAIITGSFISCWLPFFILAIVRPFCADACYTPPVLLSVINWLGYFNSLLNPVIYTIFNPDFRSAFRKILFGKYRRPRARHRERQTAVSSTECQITWVTWLVSQLQGSRSRIYAYPRCYATMTSLQQHGNMIFKSMLCYGHYVTIIFHS